jgi:hypothetical protein
LHAWQFARDLGVSERCGWTRFVSMQNLVNLLYREEVCCTRPRRPNRGGRDRHAVVDANLARRSVQHSRVACRSIVWEIWALSVDDREVDSVVVDEGETRRERL